MPTDKPDRPPPPPPPGTIIMTRGALEAMRIRAVEQGQREALLIASEAVYVSGPALVLAAITGMIQGHRTTAETMRRLRALATYTSPEPPPAS